ncbi:MAG: hypothetical protein IJL38_01120 [Bacteroidales bacterium]|nr:hypothetical protein [Bacteroidales bacterium]
MRQSIKQASLMHHYAEESVYDKQNVEPTKPEKPLIDERPKKPKEGQKILNDGK